MDYDSIRRGNVYKVLGTGAISGTIRPRVLVDSLTRRSAFDAIACLQ